MPETLRHETKVRRGCGYRKVGGLYLMTDPGEMAACGILPKELEQCPCCGGGVKHKIGFSWVQARLLNIEPAEVDGCPICADRRDACMLRTLAQSTRTKVGLIWIGASYYPEADEFIDEAQALGMSRRVHAVPKGFTLGEDWILLAHIHACPQRIDSECEKCTGCGTVFAHPDPRESEQTKPCPACSKRRPGVFALVRPTRIEQIVTETEAADAELIEKLRKRGIEPVVVPDDDLDHRGRVEPRRRADQPELVPAGEEA